MMVRPPPARIYLHKFTSDPDPAEVLWIRSTAGSGTQSDPELGRIRNSVGSGTFGPVGSRSGIIVPDPDLSFLTKINVSLLNLFHKNGHFVFYNYKIHIFP
jgi:hypothetical protein